MNKSFFVTGIGTDVGKTVCSAILTGALKADYWKPIQSGDLEISDCRKISDWLEKVTVHPERHQFKLAASPHQSARAENIEIKLSDFKLPKTSNSLIVEGAGGLFVPINDTEFVIDVIQWLNIPVILVARDYLGCINHSLLSIVALKEKQIKLDYFIFNGDFNSDTKDILLKHLSKDIKIIEIPEFKILSKQAIQQTIQTINL